jgi:hypothetical protein
LNPAGTVGQMRDLRSLVMGAGGGRLRALEGSSRSGSKAQGAGTKRVLRLVLRADGHDWAFPPVCVARAAKATVAAGLVFR